MITCLLALPIGCVAEPAGAALNEEVSMRAAPGAAESSSDGSEIKGSAVADEEDPSCGIITHSLLTISINGLTEKEDLIVPADASAVIGVRVSNLTGYPVTISLDARLTISGVAHKLPLTEAEPVADGSDADIDLQLSATLLESLDNLDYPADLDVHGVFSIDGEPRGSRSLGLIFLFRDTAGLHIFENHGLRERHGRGDLNGLHSFELTSDAGEQGFGRAIQTGPFATIEEALSASKK